MNETLSESKFFNWRLLFAVAMITMNFSLGIVSSLHQNVLLAQKILFSTQIHVTFLQFLPQIQAGIIQKSRAKIRKIYVELMFTFRLYMRGSNSVNPRKTFTKSHSCNILKN